VQEGQSQVAEESDGTAGSELTCRPRQHAREWAMLAVHRVVVGPPEERPHHVFTGPSPLRTRQRFLTFMAFTRVRSSALSQSISARVVCPHYTLEERSSHSALRRVATSAQISPAALRHIAVTFGSAWGPNPATWAARLGALSERSVP